MTSAVRRKAPTRRGAAMHLLLLVLAALAHPTASHPAAAVQGSFAGAPRSPSGGAGGAGTAGAAAGAAAAPTPTHRFFNRLDANRDGQLEPEELAHHITRALGDTTTADDLSSPAIPSGDPDTFAAAAGAGAGAVSWPKTGLQDAGVSQGGVGDGAAGGPLYMTRAQVLSAVQQAVDSVDGADAGSTISLPELERHLSRAVLRGIRVSDWVAHGLSLPRYRGAFLTHGVTPLDFPYLVEGGGDLLASELGVTSKLHQQRILRAMQRQMLALGREPSPPAGLSCRPAGGVAVGNINEAATSVLRMALSWRAPEDPGQPHFHSYQLQRLAVGGVGGSRGGSSSAGGWATVGEIDAEAAPVSVVDQVPAEGVYRYRVAAWNLHGRSTWVVSGDCAVGAWGGAGFAGTGVSREAEAGVCGGVDESLQQQHAQALAAAPSRALVLVAPSSGSGPASWADPTPWTAAQTGSGTGGHNAATPAGAALLTANLMSSGPQGLGTAGAPAPGSAPRSPAPAAAAAVAAAATAQLGRWLWALANSLLLVFIPLCVRLLPLPLLSRAQRALVRMLLLPLGRVGRPGAGPDEDAAAAAQDAAPGMPSPAAVVPPQPLSRPTSRGREAIGNSNSSRPRPAGAAAPAAAAAASAAAARDSGAVAAAAGDPSHAPPFDESPQQRALRLLLDSGAGGSGGRSSSPAPAAAAASRGMPRSGSEGRLAAIGGGRALSFQELSFASAYASALEQTEAVQRGQSSPVLGRPAGALEGNNAAFGGGAGSDGDDWEDLGTGSGGGAYTAAAAEAAAVMPAGRVDKRRCAAPGCNQRFDMRNLRAMWERHYCGRCQRAFCLSHTAYSTHGPGGQCGADSGCCCFACFAEFTPAYRAELSARNTLRHRQRSLSGGPAVAGAQRSGGGGGGIWPERGTPRKQPTPPPQRRGGGTRGQQQQQQQQGVAEGSGRVDSPPPPQQPQQQHQQQQQQHLESREQPSAATSPSSSRARALWRRGWAKLKAKGSAIGTGPSGLNGDGAGGSGS